MKSPLEAAAVKAEVLVPGEEQLWRSHEMGIFVGRRVDLGRSQGSMRNGCQMSNSDFGLPFRREEVSGLILLTSEGQEVEKVPGVKAF